MQAEALLVLRCGLAGVVWCGIRMQAEALLVLRCGLAWVVWYPYAG